MSPPTASMRTARWLATGAGLGRLPWAPGTWGSVAGLALGCLVRPLTPPGLERAAVGLAFLLCVPICARAEQALGQHDPPAVILDEIWAMLAVRFLLPAGVSWMELLVALALFRAFDTLKPPPLRLLAKLPGGWGIMADDAGAAAYTALVLHAVQWLGG